jgi:hypothetical protein
MEENQDEQCYLLEFTEIIKNTIFFGYDLIKALKEIN